MLNIPQQGKGKKGLYHLCEAAKGGLGTIRVYYCFPVADLHKLSARLSSFSQDSSTIIKELQTLTVSFDLHWHNIRVFLNIFCIRDEKS
jgi:hypothetical protein